MKRHPEHIAIRERLVVHHLCVFLVQLLFLHRFEFFEQESQLLKQTVDDNSRLSKVENYKTITYFVEGALREQRRKLGNEGRDALLKRKRLVLQKGELALRRRLAVGREDFCALRIHYQDEFIFNDYLPYEL